VVVVGLTGTRFPLVTGIFPGIITPVPPVNMAVRLVPLPPAVIPDGLAVKLTMAGAGYTVTVACCVITVPAAGVTVRV
jgi:hypothetical protein